MSARSGFWLVATVLLLLSLPTTVSQSFSAKADEGPTKTRPAGTDQFGDPLPPGVVARLGTSRLCLGNVGFLAFSPNSKLLAGVGSLGRLQLWEASSGKTLLEWEHHRIDVFPTRPAFSPDSRVLAMGCSDNMLRFWDTATGREIRKLPCDPYPSSVVFSPDGRHLATVGQDMSVQLWDLVEGKSLGQLGNLKNVRALAFSADGKTALVMSLSRDAGSKVTFSQWEVGTRKECPGSKTEIDIYSTEGLAPNGKYYALFTPGSKTLRLVDPTSGKELNRTEEEVNWNGRIAFSGDGRMVTASSKDGIVRVWETASGKMLHQFKGLRTSLHCVALSQDGKLLALAGRADQAIHIWDVAAARKLHDFPGHPTWPLAVAYSRDGKTVTTVNRDGIQSTPTREWGDWSLRQWDAVTGKELRVTQRDPEGEIRHAVLSPDGSRSATVTHDGKLRIWDVAAGKELHMLKVPTTEVTWNDGKVDHKFQYQAITTPAFSPDGKTLFSGHQKSILRWDTTMGKELPSLKTPEDIASPTCLPCPDGRTLLVIGGDFRNARLVLMDALSGGILREFKGGERPLQLQGCAFSPDGRTLALTDNQAVALWEVASGHERGRLQEGTGRVFGLAFSPDGRFLAAADGRFHAKAGIQENSIRFWHLASGRSVTAFDGQRIRRDSMAFSPDGKRLALAGSHNDVLICDVESLVGKGLLEPGKLLANDLESLWKELSGGDSVKAFRAIRRLSAFPAEAVPFLDQRLKALPRLDERMIARLIANLDHDEFAVREKATQELEKMGPAIEPALRRALEGQRGVEARARVQGLLEKLRPKGVPLPSTELISLRVLEVLELSNSAVARQVLVELAKGKPEVRLTQEATAVLERLTKQGPRP